MKFRPCIDIHDGKVKQIVGGTLHEDGQHSNVRENYVADADAGYFASLYKESRLCGGHIILLNAAGTKEYEADMEQARKALSVYPGGMQIGGGITSENACKMLDLGASHVIVTSYVFKNGIIDFDNLYKLSNLTGPEHLVLDVSCRKKGNDYYVVTDRWQKYTEEVFSEKLLLSLMPFCNEFLVHAVDVEGCASGIEADIAGLLGMCSDVRTTYAGGISSEADIKELEYLGKGRVDFTIGSALDLFGGKLSFYNIAHKYC